MRSLLLIIFVFLSLLVEAQQADIKGTVRDTKGTGVEGVSVALKGTTYLSLTDSRGNYILRNIPYGNYVLVVFLYDKQTQETNLNINQANYSLDYTLQELSTTLDAVSVESDKEVTTGLARLNAIENFGIYEGKKTEVIVLRDMTVNTATNNSRQLYSKISGLNIWESDQAGLQLGIGGRGLNPNRTSNFNTRQNGYDISADALGYPESYYTPPAEALEQIEIIRGAASLQYGTQFGGLLNFKFKCGTSDRKIELLSRQSVGSWGFFGSFNSIGGTIAKGKVNYYTYYNFKRADGYRPNSDFNYHNVYASVQYDPTDKLSMTVDITHMTYQAHQPGGLTDTDFNNDPRQSVRARNWFSVDWNLMALSFTYKFSSRTQLNLRNYALSAQRQALGNLEKVNVIDLGGNRTLIDGDFKNFANETRLLHRYTLAGKQSALIIGTRIYHGTTTAGQGDANDGSGQDFYFLNPENLENSDYQFPNFNFSAFAENIFDISSKFSITPGIRFENIQTYSEGYYRTYVRDLAGNIVSVTTTEEDLERKRSFVIAGVGLSYKPKDNREWYANVSQNYRAINFSDLHINNPSLVVDPNIQDEKGFTADLGWRGKVKNNMSFDVTGFYVGYNGKIGQMYRADQPPLYNDYRFRGNLADASIMGIEALGEFNLSSMFNISQRSQWSVFVNLSLINARYKNSEDNAIEGKYVEMVPPFVARTGASYRKGGFTSFIQFSYVARHYSDATNAIRTASAVEGEIPGYSVMDWSLSYTKKLMTFSGSCNNLLNQHYFTRRADSYPGPGIIPADGRGFYLSVQVKVGK